LTFDAIYVLCLFLNTAPSSSAAHDPGPNPDGAETLAQSPDRAAERFAMLRELADIGMEMARALQSEVRARAEAVEEASEAPKSVAELGLAFSRVSRAVRQTLALEARLEDDRLDRERAAEAAEDAQSQSNSEMSERAARVRAKLMQLLHPDRERDHQWDDDWFEELSDEPDVERGEGFVSDRPAADVVAGVCGDLGLEPDLRLWAEDDGAAVSTARGVGGIPLAMSEQQNEPPATNSPRPDEPRGRPP
jgi:ElaB/YqjD/DUF883 family membrane-anchored ribosome-binding protein